ncbi:MAG TPA: M15 family metallopeptidase [Thermoleophilaceae bacterium]|nr:M15 family metallopeptidase [Thermoleophilaceae bacterium]
MTYSAPARTTTRRIRIRWIRVAGLLVAIVAIAAALGSKSPVSSSSTLSSPSTASSRSPAAPPVNRSRNEQRDALGEAGGAVPDGTTIFDDEVPGVANLDPALLSAMRRATTDAAAAGVELVVNSGWRSPAYEDQLRREAIAKYGSEAEAARWVATGTTSPHVSGDAVDIGPASATRWLSSHGAGYGLCQIYGNEPWHYELRTEAIGRGCPAMYGDPTRDPRMRQ